LKKEPTGNVQKIPIVFFDNRTELPDWFKWILRDIDGSVPVYVITPAKVSWSRKLPNNIIFVTPESLDYGKSYSDFQDSYVHLSTHSSDFELACFERYFALEELMKRNRYAEAWHLDTDVWVTPSLSEIYCPGMIFSSTSKTNVPASAHTAKFTDTGITAFTSFLKSTFYQENLFELETFYRERITMQLTGGVCDMTALGYWLNRYSDQDWFNSEGFRADSLQLNHIFGDLRDTFSRFGIESSKNKKFIILTKRNRNFELRYKKNRIKFATIHFQGHHKSLVTQIALLRIIMGGRNFGHFSFL
jgi:hypothetical protein